MQQFPFTQLNALLKFKLAHTPASSPVQKPLTAEIVNGSELPSAASSPASLLAFA